MARWDPLIEQLRAYRVAIGEPSYSELAGRVSKAREERGDPAAVAAVARSTIYDAFQTGRARLNFDLVRDIGLVMGVDSDDIDGWIAACNGGDAEPECQADPMPSRRFVGAIILGSIAINMVGREFVDLLHLPIYLDMVGTALAAVALGPWYGAFVGLSTNVLGSIGSGVASFPFAIVNVAGALIWGYGVWRYGMGRTLPKFFALNVIVAVACSLIAVPILMLVFGGSVGQGQDTITDTFVELGSGLLAAVGASNLMTSTADKLLSGFVALVVIAALPWHLRRRVPLVMADQRV